MGFGLCSNSCPLSNEVTLHIAEYRRSLPSSPMHGAVSWHGATRRNYRCLDVLSTGSILGHGRVPAKQRRRSLFQFFHRAVLITVTSFVFSFFAPLAPAHDTDQSTNLAFARRSGLPGPGRYAGLNHGAESAPGAYSAWIASSCGCLASSLCHCCQLVSSLQ